jgi:hypothetical protein
VRAKKGNIWGGISHFVVMIDTISPAKFILDIEPNLSSVISTLRPVISFITTDARSGLDHYELKTVSLNKNEQEATDFFIETSSPYRLSLDSGNHKVIVRAFDKAGNWRDATKKLTIIPQGKFVVSRQGINFWILFLPWWTVVLILCLLIATFAAIAILGRKYHLEIYKVRKKQKEDTKEL